MRYLGIDYGTKRVGIAYSDEAGEFAFALTVLQNDGKLFNELKKIISEKKVEAVVLGESKNFKGEDNAIMSAIADFKKKFEAETGLPVFLEPEFMTSAEADRMNVRDSGKNRRSGIRLRQPEVNNVMLDASAAAIILKSYFDKKTNNI